MAAVQILEVAEIDSLGRELDIFERAQAPAAELVAQGLYPPLPICSNTLIWGFDILRSAKLENVPELNVLVVPPCSRAWMLSLALKLEDRAGSFSWPEKERMLTFLAEPQDSQMEARGAADLMEELSPLIENHRDPQLAVKINSFAALPVDLKDQVAKDQIDLKSAGRVQSLPVEVFASIRSSTLTFSQRRQLLTELFEIRGKLELSERDTVILTRKALKGAQPLDVIRRLRYPTLSTLQERFSALQEELLQGSGVQLKPPPYFEGEAFSVEFRFHNARTLDRKLSALHALEGKLDALFELLH
jgi:hypothetical protein